MSILPTADKTLLGYTKNCNLNCATMRNVAS